VRWTTPREPLADHDSISGSRPAGPCRDARPPTPPGRRPAGSGSNGDKLGAPRTWARSSRSRQLVIEATVSLSDLTYFPTSLGWCAMSAVDRAIVGTAGATVVGLAGIAGAISYSHMAELARLHGEVGWRSHAFPVPVDGIEVVASLVLLAHRRAGTRAGLAAVGGVGGGYGGERGRERRGRRIGPGRSPGGRVAGGGAPGGDQAAGRSARRPVRAGPRRPRSAVPGWSGPPVSRSR
jgi:hypothetical protein